LSYQEISLKNFGFSSTPEPASKIDELLSWMKSLETT